MSPESRYLICEGREIHFLEWGSQHKDVVIAWHGLARTGRDMDELARHLSGHYRVICPDTIGSGLSPVEPPTRERIQPGVLQPPGGVTGRSARAGAFPLGRHLDGRCHRHGLRCRARCRAGSRGWCSTTSARSWPHRRSSASVPMRAARPSFATVGELEQYFPHRLQTLWLSDRRAVDLAHRELHAPFAQWLGDAALRSGHGDAVHPPP